MNKFVNNPQDIKHFGAIPHTLNNSLHLYYISKVHSANVENVNI